MSYQVPEHIDKNKVFIVAKSSAQERLDAQYHKERFDFAEYHRLSEYVSIKGGKRIPKGMNYSSDLNSPYLYLRVADFPDDYYMDFRNLKRIDKSLYDKLSRYEINNGEIALSIAGSIGKVFLLRNIPEEYNIVLTENCARISVKDTSCLLPEYLSVVLTLPIVQKQLMLNYVQTTIAKLSLERIGKIMIPPIPDKEKQLSIINTYQLAVERKHLNFQKAQQLLDSIDEYLLNELGIRIPNDQTPSVKNRIFIINLNRLERDRLDSNYFDGKYRNLLNCICNGKYELVPLNNVTSFLSTGQTPKSCYYTEEKTNYPIIKAGSYSGFGIDLNKVAYTIDKQSYSVQKGDIFILSAAHQAEYIAKQIYYLYESPLQNTSFVGELLCVRANNSVNSIYLYALLSTFLYKTLLNREKRGQTSHLYSQDVKQVLIPIPPINKQNEIAEHIEEIRTQALALQEEGKRILEDAKHEVERMIIG